ncbi:MAG TPA: S8 family serine peptidase [Armatimonadota bacterium]|jgi:hypothetical protein
MRVLRWLVIAAAGALAAFPSAYAQARPTRAYAPDRVLVKWKDSIPAQTAMRFRMSRSRPRARVSTVEVPLGSSVEATLQSLRKDPRVLYAGPNYTRRALTLPAPNEPVWDLADPTPDYYTRNYDATVADGYQMPHTWALQLIQALEAWNLYPGQYYTAAIRPPNPVKIAVLDTGCDLSHPDWIDAGGVSPSIADGGQLDIAEAVSFSTRTATGGPTPLVSDPVGHGTFTAGIVGAAVNNGGPTSPAGGALGLAYPAQVLPIQVLNTADGGTVEDEIDGIYYAVDHGAQIISMSLGDYTYTPFEQDAVDYAWEHNVLVVAAAGNDGVACGGGAGQNRPLYPAANNHVLAVGATGPDDSVASYSNTGPYVGIAAPGGDAVDAGVVLFDVLPVTTQFGIWSLFPTSDYALRNPTDCQGNQIDQYTNYNYDYSVGTSAACPFVAALAGLYAMKNGITRETPNAPAILWQAIQRGAENTQNVAYGGWSSLGGFGRINAYNTLAGVNPRASTVGCIVGKVTSNSNAVSGTRISATNGTANAIATTRADGGFRLANLAPGAWTVTASTTLTTGSLNVTVLAGVDNFGADFIFPWPPGDADHNGRADIRDAVIALRLLLNTATPDPAASARADVYPWAGTGGRTHGDGQLTLDDVRSILKIASGLGV